MIKKEEKGAITLEASLVLTIFIMGYMCMMSLVQIVRAQTILQYAVDQAALSISRNSYILTKTGIVDEIYGTSEKGTKIEGDTMQVVSDIKTFFSNLGALPSSDAKDIIPNAQNVMDDYDTMKGSVEGYSEEYLKSKDEIWDALTTWATFKAENIVTKAAVEALVKSQVENQLEVMGQTDADTYLKKLGIKNGLNGLEFDGSQWMMANKEGKPGIRIEMSYDMEYNWYYFVIKDLKYKVTAYTALW